MRQGSTFRSAAEGRRRRTGSTGLVAADDPAGSQPLQRAHRPDGQLCARGRALEGWRESTVDVDVRFEPEDDSLLRRLAELKEEQEINVELASPPDFIPELPEWRERSPFLFREGNLDVHHFDPYSQALSKVERGFELDLEDVAAMRARGLVEASRALELFDAIDAELYRYPAISPASLRQAVQRAFGEKR